MADSNQTSTLPREKKLVTSPAKQKVQLSNAELNWLRATEGIGVETLDNELSQQILFPSFEATEPKVTPVPTFMGSISFSETSLGEAATKSAQETVVKVAEKTADIVVANAKDVVDASADLLRYITGAPERVSYTTTNTAPSSNVENNTQTSSDAANKEIRIKQIHSFLETTDTAQHLARREEDTKMALRITEKPNITEEEARILSVNLNYAEHLQNINAYTSVAAKLSEVRITQMTQARAQSIQETKGQGVNLDLNKVAEGGSILSQTGGAGAG